MPPPLSPPFCLFMSLSVLSLFCPFPDPHCLVPAFYWHVESGPALLLALRGLQSTCRGGGGGEDGGGGEGGGRGGGETKIQCLRLPLSSHFLVFPDDFHLTATSNVLFQSKRRWKRRRRCWVRRWRRRRRRWWWRRRRWRRRWR